MNFRELVAELEARGELLRIGAEVDIEYELPALLVQAEARDMACRFDRVAGADFAAVGAVLTSPRRWALALGVVESAFDEPNALESYMRDAVASPVEPELVESAPVSANRIAGARVDIGRLPAPLFFSGDSHRFISAGLGFSLDPETGVQNVGFYRSPLVDRRTISVSAGPTSDLRRIYNLHRDRRAPLQIAMAVGVPPALQIAAAADLPPGVSDVAVAGALQGRPIRLARCQTSGILVPADAEIVIELTVELDEWIDNTMGEFGDQYGKTASPVATIDAITHRDDALFHVIMAGMNREHNQLGRMLGYDLRRAIMERLREDHEEVADVAVDMTPQRTGMRAQVTVAVDKTSDAQPGRIIEEVYGMKIGRFPMSMLMYRVVVVDTDVDIYDHRDIDWAIASRMNAAGQISVREVQTGRGATVVRLGCDATAPIAQRAELRRPDIPDADRYRLDDYLRGV